MFISYLTVANFAFIIRKYPNAERDFYLQKTDEIFEILPNNRIQIVNALKLGANDFEDALQYEAALQGDCDCIITRNIKDFDFSKIPILTLQEFTERYL